MINSMPVVSSQYWNQVHGNTPDEVRQDAEGLQTMRTLGSNMAWLLKMYSGRSGSGNHIRAGTCNENKFYSVKSSVEIKRN